MTLLWYWQRLGAYDSQSLFYVFTGVGSKRRDGS